MLWRCILFHFFFSISLAHAFAQDIVTDEWKKFIPSADIPSDVKCRRSNNNIDLVLFHGRYYVAFRTAPTHFASKKTKLYIISSPDRQHWSLETSFFTGTDMREPRFAVFRDTLHFYFFEAGTKMFRFEPKHIWTSRLCDSGWTAKVKTNLDGYVDWRLRTLNDRLYLSAYYGVNLYNEGHHADLRLFSSEDGIRFNPISKDPQVHTMGAEEGEFIFDKTGDLWATVRLEGSGSYLCHASKDSIGLWAKKFSKFKYDSALLFEQGDDLYLVARRNLKGEATQVEVPDKKQRRKNLIRYSFSKKVTALYKIDKDKMEIRQVMDFPSTGDTAFPAICSVDGKTFYLLNYSSDIHKRQKIWIGGQLGKTYIYQTLLHFR